ncbi:hypothetical protein B0H16DRAFT_1903755 [Mycena metata]|uniref:Uncharacterized protein n=1 Tax=Mycena metata TaxID=1033252 RepID=A0AAD7GLR2_9AGAR|nr:hypothetical protein B0H16DRAFT_1903755 [Mycena metata]
MPATFGVPNLLWSIKISEFFIKFNDITIGHNSGFSCPASTAAFDAAEGWDPLSGLGTPDYLRLLAAALAA